MDKVQQAGENRKLKRDKDKKEFVNLRCKNQDCLKVHKHSQKGFTWTVFQLCPTCYKAAILEKDLKGEWVLA